MRSLERKIINQGYCCIAGVDEAGRGPLAGPVVAGAVIMPMENNIEGIADSKSISEKKREILYKKICKEAISYGIGIVDADVIDKINILAATYLAMKRCIESLSIKPDFILVDGRSTIPDIHIKQHAEIKGDKHCYCIAAASIIAKVFRDKIMYKMHDMYGKYNFAKHKGYGTKEHLNALKEYGPCPFHRRTFKGVKELCPGEKF